MRLLPPFVLRLLFPSFAIFLFILCVWCLCCSKVTCTLTDGRKFLAEVKGSDTLSDLAVLQIDRDVGSDQTPLPEVTLGDSQDLQVIYTAGVTVHPFFVRLFSREGARGRRARKFGAGASLLLLAVVNRQSRVCLATETPFSVSLSVVSRFAAHLSSVRSLKENDHITRTNTVNGPASARTGSR